MPAAFTQSHRHFKTLITLVVSMTGGTLLLFWVAHLSPVTPLRSQTTALPVWTDITVRAQDAESPKGFFHYRIDEQGRVFQSYAWKVGQHDQDTPGTIQILLSCPTRDSQLMPAQVNALSHILGQLRSQFTISNDRVHVLQGFDGVNATNYRSDHLRRT